MQNFDDNPMKNLFSIGEAAKRGNISTRTLRYYEEVDLIEPDFVDTNGYRYYSLKTILEIPIIKYLKLMNFNLDEIKIHLKNSNYSQMEENFNSQLKKCDDDINELMCRKQVIKDWKELIQEACLVLSMKPEQVHIKYFDNLEYIQFPIEFAYDYHASILDLTFANFVEEEHNIISGPVMFYFSSLYERLDNESKGKPIKSLYIQKPLKKIKRQEHIFKTAASLYACKYHIGSHKELFKSYNSLLEWIKASGYELEGFVIERFVTDYWSTYDESKHVTEIIAPIKSKN